MKKKVIFVVHHMTIGGVQKSLISALNAMDYDKFDITLYLRKNRTDILDLINKNVTIIINEDLHHYYMLPYVLFYQIISFFCHIFKLSNTEMKIHSKIADYIRNRQMLYEKQKYFNTKHYDIAVSYSERYEAEFVLDYLQATRKILCLQACENDLPNLYQRIFPNYDAIVCEDIAIADYFNNEIKNIYDKFVIIPNYTDKLFLLNQATSYSIKKENKLTLCSLGRIVDVKGFDLAINAADILKKKGIEFVWLFVGDGPQKKHLENIVIQLNLNEYVKFCGMQKNPYPYINVCDIFVQPSKSEAMSIAVLEAMVMNKPVITTKTIGGTKIVKDEITGLHADINGKSIAEAILRLYNDKKLYNHIVNNLSTVDYDIEKIRYQKQWNTVLDGIKDAI